MMANAGWAALTSGRGCIRATGVPHLEQVRAGMMQGGHASLYLFFGVFLEQRR
jgi:hypothetical protein